MILTLDIGNSNIKTALFEGEEMAHYWRISTSLSKTSDEYGILLMNMFAHEGVKPEEVEGIVISSVVPKVLDTVRESMLSVFGLEPLIVTCESDLGLSLEVPEPHKVGRDRLADAAWAAAHYPLPLVTVDLGTATTFNVVKEGAVFCGGVIAAGMETGLKALGAHTAQLPKLELEAPERVIGIDTASCMRSGAVYGAAALVDGVVRSIEEELGAPVTLVITGGGAPYIDRLVRHPHSYDPDMILKGLAYLYQRNREK